MVFTLPSEEAKCEVRCRSDQTQLKNPLSFIVAFEIKAEKMWVAAHPAGTRSTPKYLNYCFSFSFFFLFFFPPLNEQFQDMPDPLFLLPLNYYRDFI